MRNEHSLRSEIERLNAQIELQKKEYRDLWLDFAMFRIMHEDIAYQCNQKQDMLSDYQNFVARLKAECPMAYNTMVKEH